MIELVFWKSTQEAIVEDGHEREEISSNGNSKEAN